MTTLTAPAPQANIAANNGENPINLFQLGCLFVIKSSYWSCRIGNEPQDFHLSPHEVESKAIASFGSKELIDPHQGRKVFQQIEKKARHQLAKYSKPFPAANAHFVPWEHAPELIDKLEALKAEFDQAVEDFLLQYPQLRADWQFEHPDVPDVRCTGDVRLHPRVKLDDVDAQLVELGIVLERVREPLAPREQVGVEPNIAVLPLRIFGALLCT